MSGAPGALALLALLLTQAAGCAAASERRPPARPATVGATPAARRTPAPAAESPPAVYAPVAGDGSRFFVAGNGTLAIRSIAFGERVRVTYRHPDGTYDGEALARLRHVLRSKDGKEGPITPRFVELLGWVHLRSGAPLELLSGYRSPSYNEGLRKRGRKAASGSMHTEGMAADLTFPRGAIPELWLALRGLECCGAGSYAGQGFMHVDVGTPRFWEATTSRVDENLSAGNARLFGRTDFDRYRAGDSVEVVLHSLTVPPVWIARTARLVPDGGGDGAPVRVEVSGAPPGEGCIESDARTRFQVAGAPATARARLVLETCEPRPERTPLHVESNPVAIE